MRANEFIIEISKKYDNMIPPPHWNPRWPVEYRTIYDRYKRGDRMFDSEMQIIGMMDNYVPRKNNLYWWLDQREKLVLIPGIVDLYSKGKTPTDIANFYKLPLEKVMSILQSQGIAGRTFRT